MTIFAIFCGVLALTSLRKKQYHRCEFFVLMGIFCPVIQTSLEQFAHNAIVAIAFLGIGVLTLVLAIVALANGPETEPADIG